MSQRQVQINAELARCALASDVLEIVRRSVEEFNVVNCGTALSRIARAPDGRRLVAREGSDPTLASLLAAAAGLVRQHARHVESRQLASLLHACGKLGVGKLESLSRPSLKPKIRRKTRACAREWASVQPNVRVGWMAQAAVEFEGLGACPAKKAMSHEYDGTDAVV